MEKIMKVGIPSEFETLCLENVWMYNILLLASKKAITKRWLVKDSRGLAQGGSGYLHNGEANIPS